MMSIGSHSHNGGQVLATLLYNGKRYKLTKPRTVIGSGNSVDIRINDPLVAKSHVEIHFISLKRALFNAAGQKCAQQAQTPQRAYTVLLKVFSNSSSANIANMNIFLNGQRVTNSIVLKDQDCIVFGNKRHTFLFSLSAGTAGAGSSKQQVQPPVTPGGLSSFVTPSKVTKMTTAMMMPLRQKHLALLSGGSLNDDHQRQKQSTPAGGSEGQRCQYLFSSSVKTPRPSALSPLKQNLTPFSARMERRLREGNLKKAYSPTVARFFGQINAKSSLILKRLESMFEQNDDGGSGGGGGGSASSSSSPSSSSSCSDDHAKGSPVSFSSSKSTKEGEEDAHSENQNEEKEEKENEDQLVIYQKAPEMCIENLQKERENLQEVVTPPHQTEEVVEDEKEENEPINDEVVVVDLCAHDETKELDNKDESLPEEIQEEVEEKEGESKSVNADEIDAGDVGGNPKPNESQASLTENQSEECFLTEKDEGKAVDAEMHVDEADEPKLIDFNQTSSNDETQSEEVIQSEEEEEKKTTSPTASDEEAIVEQPPPQPELHSIEKVVEVEKEENEPIIDEVVVVETKEMEKKDDSLAEEIQEEVEEKAGESKSSASADEVDVGGVGGNTEPNESQASLAEVQSEECFLAEEEEQTSGDEEGEEESKAVGDEMHVDDATEPKLIENLTPRSDDTQSKEVIHLEEEEDKETAAPPAGAEEEAIVEQRVPMLPPQPELYSNLISDVGLQSPSNSNSNSSSNSSSPYSSSPSTVIERVIAHSPPPPVEMPTPLLITSANRPSTSSVENSPFSSGQVSPPPPPQSPTPTISVHSSSSSSSSSSSPPSSPSPAIAELVSPVVITRRAGLRTRTTQPKRYIDEVSSEAEVQLAEKLFKKKQRQPKRGGKTAKAKVVKAKVVAVVPKTAAKGKAKTRATKKAAKTRKQSAGKSNNKYNSGNDADDSDSSHNSSIENQPQPQQAFTPVKTRRRMVKLYSAQKSKSPLLEHPVKMVEGTAAEQVKENLPSKKKKVRFSRVLTSYASVANGGASLIDYLDELTEQANDDHRRMSSGLDPIITATAAPTNKRGVGIGRRTRSHGQTQLDGSFTSRQTESLRLVLEDEFDPDMHK